MLRGMSLRPLIAICGTTGVGKSKLAIELALSLARDHEHHEHGYRGARIINADAMQVYAGMDLITNKVPVEDQCGVEHLLMGFKKPGEQYVVGQWVKDAMQLIEETHNRNQIPIVVGGTAYWIQHLIFPNRLASLEKTELTDERKSDTSSPAPMSDQLRRAVNSLSPQSLRLYENIPKQLGSDDIDREEAFAMHSLLASLDPQVAQRWHWRDSRKVLRSLNVIKESGKLSSELISEQSKVQEQPRYRSLFFWLYAKPEALNPRLDARVDDMVQRGLLREVQELIDLAKEHRQQDATSLGTSSEKLESDSPHFDYTLGLYQSIGFKEFSQYLSTPDPTPQMYSAALERMKLSTRQYAKRQVKWMQNKLLPAIYSVNSGEADEGRKMGVYLLDATNLDAWKSNVQDVAERITHDFLANRPLPDPLSLSDSARQLLSIPEKDVSPTAVLSARRKIICPTCTINETEPVMIEEGTEWTRHVNSRTHKHMVRKAARKAEWESWKEKRERGEISRERSDERELRSRREGDASAGSVDVEDSISLLHDDGIAKG
ncbi:tRNA isopentenyltransferase [Panus rudis PR-1116 ss-1]|nr:tRNA isopentenyltransferase [Panus rudis PR-1116 ss-1]